MLDYRRFIRPKPIMLLIGLTLVLAVGFADYATGTEVSFSIFYLLPVSLITWFVGRRQGIFISALCALVWFAGDSPLGAHSYSHPAIAYWNAAIRGGAFILVVLVLSRLKIALEHEREVSRLKSDMLSLVSHEFLNTLTTMGMAAEMLKDEEKSPLDGERQDLYSILERGWTTLRQSVINFLSLTKFESGQFTLNPRRTDLTRLVREALPLLAPLARRTGVEISVEVPEGMTMVRSDPEALSVVIANLASNAIKYSPNRGHVRIRIAAEGPNGENVRLSVIDNGLGIRAEDQEKIYSGFYRTREAKDASGGFGIGLKISQAILQSHGSRLELESKPGVGSRFHFALPASKDPE